MIQRDSQEWLTAKAYGDVAEKAVAQYFIDRGYQAYQTIGKANFDLLLQTGVEVKHDRVASKTGQVAIEFEYNGQSSGVHTSQADYWAIVVGETIYIIQTRRLRELISSKPLQERNAGDKGKSRIKLLPVEELKGANGVRVVNLKDYQS